MLNVKICVAFLIFCVSFLSLVNLGHCGAASPYTYFNYGDMDPFMNFDGTISDLAPIYRQVFVGLLAPIHPSLFPPNLLTIKSRLSELILAGELEVAPLLQYLMKFQHLDSFDLMIAALITLRDTLPPECYLKRELDQLLVYSIFRRSQTGLPYSPVGRNLMMNRQLPPFSSIPLPPTPQLTCDVINKMLRYFQFLFSQFNCEQCMMRGPNMGGLLLAKENIERTRKRDSVNVARVNDMRRKLINPQIVKKTVYSQSRRVSSSSEQYKQLLSSLPKPANEMETKHYSIVQEFLQSNELEKYMSDVNFTRGTNKEDLLYIIMKTVVQRTTDVRIQTAFQYYLNMNMHASLLKLIPQPQDKEEKVKYELIKSFLSSKEVYKYLKDIDLDVYNDSALLLKTILRIIANSDLDIKIKEAFAYYLNYQESLAALELYTKKEITKHFDLTKIFVDTLDVNNLSPDAKLHFKNFFKFISSISREQIKNFDTWSEVKTKGEFMKAFFRFLLDQEFVPEDVRKSIVTLEPLVKMDGKGAAPP